jgi:hypothetical protein
MYKTGPSKIVSCVSNKGFYCATDEDGDLVMNKSTIAAVNYIAVNYTRPNVLKERDRYMADPSLLNEALNDRDTNGVTKYVRCDELQCYLVKGPITEHIYQKLGSTSDRIKELLDTMVGRRMAVDDTREDKKEIHRLFLKHDKWRSEIISI